MGSTSCQSGEAVADLGLVAWGGGVPRISKGRQIY